MIHAASGGENGIMLSAHFNLFRISKLNFWGAKNPSFFRHLFIVFLIWLIGGWPTLVFALPQDGQIVSGTGAISTPTATSMQIDQNTSQMIINWDSFNIGGTESVNFTQPSSSSIALNRVIGADPSLLLGNLTANGQVFITNGSGVFFGPGSKIDTHGLIATTMKISDQDFLDQNYNFTQDIENPLTSVINEGTISATSYIGLLAPAVENRGTIVVASLGSIDLAAGKAATLDFTGDGLISFEVTEAVSGTVTDKDGNVLQDRVSNTGLIQADGGQIRMTAKDAGDVIRHVVNMEGMIQANTVVEKDGRVFLTGGSAGVVSVTGTILASGDDAGEQGGTVHVLGEKVGLFDNAVVNVSGDAGGGTALIGGDYQGKNSEVQNATATYIDPGASIFADGLTSGDGGKVIVWADDTTRVYGTLSVSAVTGNGGFVETSGKNYLDINVIPDISSIYGVGGEWLIDPNNITIVSGTGFSGINNSSPFLSTTDGSTLGVDLIITALISGDVTITTGSGGSESGDITLSTALDYDGTGSNTLTLIAANDINFNFAILDGSGSGDTLNLILDAGGVVDVNANISTGGGTFTATAGAGAVVFGTTVTIDTGAYTATTTTVTAGTIDLNATSSIGTLIVTGGTLQGSGNITVTSAMTWNGGTIDGSGTLTITSGSTVTFSITASTITNASVAVSAGGNISQSSATLTVGGSSTSFTNSSGSITMNETGNDLGANLTVDTNNSFDVFTTSNLTDLTLTIDPSSTPTFTLVAGNITTFTMTESGADITAFALAASSALNFSLTMDTGDITTTGAIDVGTGSFSITTNDSSNGSITLGTSLTLAAGSLTLDANGDNSDINFNSTATIAAGGGAITLTADDTIDFGASGAIDASANSGNISLTSNTNTSNGDNGDSIVMASGSSINAGSGTITISSTGASSGNVEIAQLTTTSSSTSAISLTSISNIQDGNGNTTADNISAVNGTLVINSVTGMSSANALEIEVASVNITNTTSNSIVFRC